MIDQSPCFDIKSILQFEVNIVAISKQFNDIKSILRSKINIKSK